MKSFTASIIVVSGLVVLVASRIRAPQETRLLYMIIGLIVVLVGVVAWIYSIGGRSDEK